MSGDDHPLVTSALRRVNTLTEQAHRLGQSEGEREWGAPHSDFLIAGIRDNVARLQQLIAEDVRSLASALATCQQALQTLDRDPPAEYDEDEP